MIELSGVSKTFDGKNYILKDISFKIKRGELTFLVGASGSGKTTLMNILFREILPSTGDGVIAGLNLADINLKNLHLFRQKIGFVFQDSRLIQSRTVFENISFVLRICGYKKSEREKMAEAAIEMVGLHSRMNALPAQLSGGEQQKVAIARAIVNHPSILLADEPVGNLDSEKSIEIMDLFYKMVNTGTTVLVATHSFELVEFMKSKTFVLNNSKIREV